MSINNLANGSEPAYIPTQEEMLVDTGDIFSQLDDLVFEGEEGYVEKESEAVDETVAEVEEVSEDIDESEESDEEFSFEDIEDEDSKPKEDHEDDPEDDEETDEDETGDDSDEEYEEESEEEVDFETYEIDLPDGSQVVLKDVIEGYRNSESLKEEKANWEVAKASFSQEAGNTVKYLKLAKLEADRIIDDYSDFDWADLSKKDPQSYVENREFLDKYRVRKQEIVAAMDDVQAKEDAVEKEAFQAQARECISTLKADIPGWNDNMYQDLMAYAIENGTPQDAIANTVDASVFKLLHKARQFDLGKQVVKAKVRRKVTGAKRVVKPSARSNGAKVSNKAKIAHKLSQGITGDSDVFEALED